MTFELPPPAVVGLQAEPSVPKRLTPPRLIEREVRVGDDFALLTRGAYNVGTADAYIDRVQTTFGSLQAYLDWAPRSDALLEQPTPSGQPLRTRIEWYRANQRGEQRVFFRWVSWAYHTKQGLSEDAIVKLIVKGFDDKMLGALAGAEHATGHAIERQGPNPRPQKDAKLRYQLGTLSEHATGRAVDLDPAHNPILSRVTWDAIARATQLTAKLGKDHWRAHPEAFFDAIEAINSRWSTMVTERVHERRLHRAYPGLSPGELAPPTGVVPRLEISRPALLDEVTVVEQLLGPQAAGSAVTLASLPRYRFMNHTRDLVLALHAQGLRWGATFYPQNVDLHHFEL